MSEEQVIAGKYRLISLLGEGGMGAVWRAEHLELCAPVAVKLLNPLLAASGEGLQRFHREAQAAAALRSPHVVQILDRGIDATTRQPFIVMELMEGESLAGRLAREGRLSAAETSRIVTHVARALARAHDVGIVHRDLKPDNVFLIRNEDEELAKVLDFGIAKSDKLGVGIQAETRTGAVLGTPYYMSPEQISGAKGVDYRTDLWALGVIACECLTGKRPFQAESIGGLALKICIEPMPVPSSLGSVPPGFDAWFVRAASREPAGRFPTAREAADELRRVCGVPCRPPERVLDGPPLPLPPVQTLSTSALVRTTGTTASSSRNRSWLGWTVGAGVMFAIAALGAALGFGNSAAKTNERAASVLPPSAAATPSIPGWRESNLPAAVPSSAGVASGSPGGAAPIASTSPTAGVRTARASANSGTAHTMPIPQTTPTADLPRTSPPAKTTVTGVKAAVPARQDGIGTAIRDRE